MSEKELALAALWQSTDQDLEDYKEWLHMPADVARTPFFHASNRMNWVKTDKFAMYLRELALNAEKHAYFVDIPGAHVPPQVPKPSQKRRASSEVIEISSDDEDAAPPPKKRAPDVRVKTEVKNEPVPVTPSGPKLPREIVKKFAKGRIMITTRESVDIVVSLKTIPQRWPPADPEKDTAFIIDVSGYSGALKTTYTGKPKGFDALVKSQDPDSYGQGTNGSTSRDTKLIILGGLASRRSNHTCQGGSCCQFFNRDILEDYERNDPEDMELTKEIFAMGLEQSKNDSLTSNSVTASFFRTAKNSKCGLAGCSGLPVLKRRLNGPSDVGKDTFIGCSRWKKTEQFDHRYLALNSGVDEEILARYMAGEPVPDVDEDEEPSCSRFVHPRHGKVTQCPHTHFRHGKLVVGEMVPRPCKVVKIVYTSMDPDVKMLVVIFRGLHSHPPWPMEKPSLEAEEDLDKCLASMGTVGTTGGRLNNSATTRAVLGSDLDVKHPAFRNKRKLRDAVLTRKDAMSPAGLNWAGILDRYEQDLKLPMADRYIRIIRMEGDLKLAVTMEAYLASLVHEVQYLVPDFTFKRVKGDLNEWEVAVWLDGDKERVSVARTYCNKSDADAFFYIFDGFFMAVKQVTGQPIRFKAFDPNGNILSILFDMEAAQVQGFARALLKLLGRAHPEQDPDVIVRYVMKLCGIHFTRSTDALVGAVGKETVNYLNRIRGLKNPADIEAWHKFCREHPDKKLHDWYEHKIRYSWLLPGYNESLSLFPQGLWDRTPHHTNLVESAHVATNRETGTRLLPLEAIDRARAYDKQRAASIRASRETCILPNHNNSDQARMRRAVGRQANVQKRHEKHSAVETELVDAVKRLEDLSEAKKAATDTVKTLKAQKKLMGRAPRNNHVQDKDGNAARIPRVSSSAPIPVVDDDSDVEMVADHRVGSSTSVVDTRSQWSAPPRWTTPDGYDSAGIPGSFDEGYSRPGSSFSMYSAAPSSASDGYDSEGFTSDFAAQSDREEGSSGQQGQDDSEEGAADVPHVGHYLLGAPGFDMAQFLADCDTYGDAWGSDF
ncbi:hypothetical protein DFH06DRAFT_1477189 [Mycena polygramma]|nr:hypothetical protein DFH06DRAFT_1477189 [Mycena polygramma]